MFFSASICSRDVAETLRSNESIKLCAAKLRKECASHRVPVPSSIVPHELVYGAMESFNHTKKKTVSGIGGSHGTIVMLFQSIRDTKLCNGQLQISKKDISNELKGNIFT